MVGKAEKSSGRWMNSVTVNIRIASANEAARPMSSTQAGIGSTIITMIAISATASRTVGCMRAEIDRVGFIARGLQKREPGARTSRLPVFGARSIAAMLPVALGAGGTQWAGPLGGSTAGVRAAGVWAASGWVP